MSNYTRTRHGLGGVTSIITAGANVASDPCLGEVASLLNDLHNAEQLGGVSALDGTTPGIGLCRAVTPLKIAVYVRRNRWVLPVAGVGIVGLLVGLGYILGQESKRKDRA